MKHTHKKNFNFLCSLKDRFSALVIENMVMRQVKPSKGAPSFFQ